MKRRLMIVSMALALTGGLAVGAPGTASAGDTQVDVVVAQGLLTISAQPASATLTGAEFHATLPSTASGSFGDITVSDGRGLLTAWAMSASATNFSKVGGGTGWDLSPTNSMTILPATVTVGPTGVSGVGTALGGALVAASTPVPVATGTNAEVLGGVTYTWNPDMDVVVPGGTTSGTYRSTVTLTAA